MKSSIKYSSLCTLLVALVAAPSLRAGQITQNIDLPVRANLIINEANCHNSGGPNVTLEGTLTLGSVCAKVTLSNNAKGTHTATVVKEYSVSLALEKSITIPKQPSRGGVGGNPHIWIQFANGGGGALSEEIYLGRCVQGLNVSKTLINEAILRAIVEGTDCSNKGGPFINIGGEVILSGINAKIIFRNNFKGTHTAEAVTSVKLLAEGTKIVLPKQPSRGGVGGNPLISIQFVDCKTGAALGDKVLLGRCTHL